MNSFRNCCTNESFFDLEKLREEMKELSKIIRSHSLRSLGQSYPYYYSLPVNNKAHFSGTVKTSVKRENNWVKPEEAFTDYVTIDITDEDEEDLTLLDKPTNEVDLSVDYSHTPGPEYVARIINPNYLSLIKTNYKKDCRTWLFKNKAARENVRARYREVKDLLRSSKRNKYAKL